jgi:PPOX class probable F420-dependent enzyme
MERKWTRTVWAIAVAVVLSWGWGVMLAEAQESKRTLAQFLAENRNATLSTIRADGTAQLTPVWFYWDGERFYISITSERVKYKNLKRDPRMSLCIDDVTGFSYAVAEGKAEIKEGDIWQDTRKILVKYRGEKGGAEYLERMKNEPRVLVILKPERWETRGLSG